MPMCLKSEAKMDTFYKNVNNVSIKMPVSLKINK